MDVRFSAGRGRGGAAGGGFAARLGRPDLATLIARIRAESRQSETEADDTDALPLRSRRWPVTYPAASMARAMTRCAVCGLRVRVAEIYSRRHDSALVGIVHKPTHRAQ